MALIFRIQIKNIKKPPVWRRLEIPESYTLHQFHTAIQIAFGWEFEHLYQFMERPYESLWSYLEQPSKGDDFFSFFSRTNEYSSKNINVSDFLKKWDLNKFVYIYDFGDDWIHEIAFEGVNSESDLKHPCCLAGKGQCPPEDCGGPWGYERIKYILDNEPNSKEAQEIEDWLYFMLYEYDPKYFDIELTNKELRETDKWFNIGPDI